MIKRPYDIRTKNVYPPIPSRQFDWCAIYEGYEPGDPIGWGLTEQEAIDDLVLNYPDVRCGAQRSCHSSTHEGSNHNARTKHRP
jgi:hypothetical protein